MSKFFKTSVTDEQLATGLAIGVPLATMGLLYSGSKIKDSNTKREEIQLKKEKFEYYKKQYANEKAKHQRPKTAAEHDEKKKKRGPGLGTALVAGAVVAGGAAYLASPDVKNFVDANVSKAYKASKSGAGTAKDYVVGSKNKYLPKLKDNLSEAWQDTKIQSDRLYEKTKVRLGKHGPMVGPEPSQRFELLRR